MRAAHAWLGSPGLGPIAAAMLVMKTPAPRGLPVRPPLCRRASALTPKDHSTAGKVRLGVITRAGDEILRSVLVVGATAVIQQLRRGQCAPASPWLVELLKRKPPKLVAALANKIVPHCLKLMVTGESYKGSSARPVSACVV